VWACVQKAAAILNAESGGGEAASRFVAQMGPKTEAARALANHTTRSVELILPEDEQTLESAGVVPLDLSDYQFDLVLANAVVIEVEVNDQPHTASVVLSDLLPMAVSSAWGMASARVIQSSTGSNSILPSVRYSLPILRPGMSAIVTSTLLVAPPTRT